MSDSARHNDVPGGGRPDHRGDPVWLSLEKLSFGLSPRLGPIDQDHVRVLQEALDELPPILVRASDDVVIDGVHRVTAARASGKARIKAYLFVGDDDAAYGLAVEANIRHGRPLTSRERVEAVRHLASLHPRWSDRRLAKLCGVSPGTAGEARRSSVDSGHSNTKVGRDGRARPVDPAGQRQQIADHLEADPSKSLRAVANEIGCAPATVMDVRKRLAQGLDPLPPKLQPHATERRLSPLERLAEDKALSSADDAGELLEWLATTSISDSDWLRFVDSVPLNRVYEVADAASAISESWKRFAAALNQRTRQR